VYLSNSDCSPVEGAPGATPTSGSGGVDLGGYGMGGSIRGVDAGCDDVVDDDEGADIASASAGEERRRPYSRRACLGGNDRY
jgi:hypothetical protein